MNDNSAYNCDDAKGKLLEFIKLSGIKTITFHQFSFLIMYFPVYMIIYELKQYLMKSGIKVKVPFESQERDKAIIENMAKEDFESFKLDNEENTLHIGLCEPVVFNKEKNENKSAILKYDDLDKLNKKELKKKLKNECLGKLENGKISYFIHLPFINFPPIYGVSLINNESIKKIKEKKENETVQKGDVCLSIADYRRHFSAKLSLLDIVDFENLAYSSYPEGSTTDWFIRKKIKFPSKNPSPICIEKLEEEFKALFDGNVDVAFTVQPWAAITDAVCSKHPYKIDIVYKDVCKRFDCTSLILKTNKDEYLILGDYILNCFKILLEKKIEELYKMSSEDLGENIEHYCKLLYEHNKNSPLDESFKFENKMALRLTIDSQIYRYLEGIEKTDQRMDDVKMFTKYIWEKYSNCPHEILSHL